MDTGNQDMTQIGDVEKTVKELVVNGETSHRTKNLNHILIIHPDGQGPYRERVSLRTVHPGQWLRDEIHHEYCLSDFLSHREEIAETDK